MKTIYQLIIILLLSTQSSAQLIYQGNIKDDKHISFKFDEKMIGKDYIRQILKKNKKTGSFKIVYAYYAGYKRDSVVYKGDITASNKQIAFINDFRRIYFRDSIGNKNVICTFLGDSIFRGDLYSNNEINLNSSGNGYNIKTHKNIVDYIIEKNINGKTIYQIDEKTKQKKIIYTTNGGEESIQIFAIIYDLYRSRNMIGDNTKLLKDSVINLKLNWDAFNDPNKGFESAEYEQTHYINNLYVINDDLIVISKNIKRDINQEMFLIVNPKTKEVYGKIHTEFNKEKVLILGKKLIFFKHIHDKKADTASTIIYSYDLLTKKTIKKHFPFAVIQQKNSSIMKDKLFLLYVKNKVDNYTGYMDSDLNLNGIVSKQFNCESVFFSTTKDTVYCLSDDQYNADDEYYKATLHSNVLKNTYNFSYKLFINKDIAVISTPQTSKIAYTYIYDNKSGKLINHDSTIFVNKIQFQNGKYWYLGHFDNFYVSKKLTLKPEIEYKWSDFKYDLSPFVKFD
jgi:hypothetical protein